MLEIIRVSGRTPEVRVLEPEDYEDALHEKLLEEAAELRAADADDRLGKAADVREVLLTLATLNGFTLEDIVRAAKAKSAERGVSRVGCGWTAADPDAERGMDCRTGPLGCGLWLVNWGLAARGTGGCSWTTFGGRCRSGSKR